MFLSGEQYEKNGEFLGQISATYFKKKIYLPHSYPVYIQFSTALTLILNNKSSMSSYTDKTVERLPMPTN